MYLHCNFCSCVKEEESDPDWATKLSIPSQFSVETMSSIKSGVPTRKARDEVINSLATLIMVHTMRPTSNDYNTVCKRLIEKHTALKDNIGSGYVSC